MSAVLLAIFTAHFFMKRWGDTLAGMLVSLAQCVEGGKCRCCGSQSSGEGIAKCCSGATECARSNSKVKRSIFFMAPIALVSAGILVMFGLLMWTMLAAAGYSEATPTLPVHLLIIIIVAAAAIVVILFLIGLGTGLYVRAKRNAEQHWLNESNVVEKVKGFASNFFSRA